MSGEEKIAVVGLGGVGGYIGGALAKVYPNVSFIARGERKNVLCTNGLTVHSDILGEFTVKPAKTTDLPNELGTQDYVFICVKNYSLEQACKEIKDIIDENTVIIPVMNGVDTARRIKYFLGEEKGIVLDALIYIITSAKTDYSILQKGSYAHLHIGRKEPEVKHIKILEQVKSVMEGAHVECIIEDDIMAAIWRKYILNCAFNITTAYYHTDAKGLREIPERVEEFRELLSEAYEVAKEKEIDLPKDVVEVHLNHFLKEQPDEATSSLRRDMDAGKNSELYTFSGYLLEEAVNMGLKLPVTQQFYEHLQQR